MRRERSLQHWESLLVYVYCWAVAVAHRVNLDKPQAPRGRQTAQAVQAAQTKRRTTGAVLFPD